MATYQHFKLEVEDSSGTVVDPSGLSVDPFRGAASSLPGQNSIDYIFSFDERQIGSVNFDPNVSGTVTPMPFVRVCHGLAIRAKGDDQYLHEVGGNVTDLDNEVNRTGSTADPELAGARTGVAYTNDAIHFLAEKRGVAPGVKKFRDHLIDCLNSLSPSYDVSLVRKTGQPDVQVIKELLQARLCELEMSLKPYPSASRPANGRPVLSSDYVDAVPAEYRSKFELTDGNSGTHGKTGEDVLVDHLEVVDRARLGTPGSGRTQLDLLAREFQQRNLQTHYFKLEATGEKSNGEKITVNFTDPQRKEILPNPGNSFMNDTLGELLLRNIYEEVV